MVSNTIRYLSREYPSGGILGVLVVVLEVFVRFLSDLLYFRENG